jgi:hypothetical protein
MCNNTMSKLDKLHLVSYILKNYVDNYPAASDVLLSDLKLAQTFILDMCDSYTQDFK